VLGKKRGCMLDDGKKKRLGEGDDVLVC